MRDIVTIDGCSGVGKSSVAKKLAAKLGFVHLNSGLLFRRVALEILNRGIIALDDNTVCSVAADLVFDFAVDDAGMTKFIVNGQEVDQEILHGDAVSEMASKIAVLPRFRAVLVEIQRGIGERFGVVLEGRDAGTVVFPDARHKFFLDAPLVVRARRRYADLLRRGVCPGLRSEEELQGVMVSMAERDERDTNRVVAPTVRADDAVLVDTSELTEVEVVDKLTFLINKAA